jgi:ATP-dependent RNA helicase DDX49/DBP8
MDSPSTSSPVNEPSDYPRKRRELSSSSGDSPRASPDRLVKHNLPSISRIKSRTKPSQSNGSSEIKETLISNGKVVDANSSFGSLQLAPWLIASLAAMEILRPTAIQKGCIPAILTGRDVIGGSRTGSGKTVAFAVPILQKWAEDPMGIFALVLTPTR